MPFEQLPGFWKVRRCVPEGQSAGGGVLQLTVEHGSALHWLLAQPNWHVVSVGAYEHMPAEQVPVDAKLRRVVALKHVVAGGELQAVSTKE